MCLNYSQASADAPEVAIIKKKKVGRRHWSAGLNW